MAAIVGIVLAAVILTVLIYPFAKKRKTESEGFEPIDRVASADTLRHLLYREPVTLRNEFEAGNISMEEYESQLGELRLDAAKLMRQRTEQRTRLLEAELELEMEVQRIRKLRSDSDLNVRDEDE